MNFLQRIPLILSPATRCGKSGIPSSSSVCVATTKFIRNLSLSSQRLDSDDESEKKSWIKKMMGGKLDPGKESHSRLLSQKNVVYELQVQLVKPDSMEGYLKETEWFVNKSREKGSEASLVGCWTVEFGDLDECILLWKYGGGYPQMNSETYKYRTDPEFIEFRKHRNQMLRSRRSQILLPFSFWPEPTTREPSHIYEMRSYNIKPGTMMEWGNHWARGIKFRQECKPTCGLFSHIGPQFQIHHFWAYEDLEKRRELRESAWARPGWDECVANTVPLIKSLESRIIVPVPFSPLQ